MKEILLAVARLIDERKWGEAHRKIRSVPLGRFDHSQRLVARALWARLLSNYSNIDPCFDAGRIETIKKFTLIGSGEIKYDTRHACFDNIKSATKFLPARDVAGLISCLFWDIILLSDTDVFVFCLRVLFDHDKRLCQQAWIQYVSMHRDYIPGYWEFVFFIKSLEFENGEDASRAAHLFLDTSHRLDLARLFDAYMTVIRQAPVEDILVAARGLTEPRHRLLLAEHLVQAKISERDIGDIVDLYKELSGNLDLSHPGLNLLLMRRSGAFRDWNDMLLQAKHAMADNRYRLPGRLMQAHALARLNETQGATILLDDVAADPAVADYDHAAINDIRLAAHRARLGLPALEDEAPKVFPQRPGKPLAQSLWIGPRLRWIEYLSIKSYIDNGWRFQLYVYEEPSDVPAGCEILDASVIIPAEDVFREGSESGLHAGSAGAFSDLFRYKLLYERGGMWTDTDVVNFEKFDPDGCRFISTELQDAGLVSLNGALMAAPARDPFMKLAYEKALETLSSRIPFFFTRIGPCLLAEVALSPEAAGFEFMRPSFLGPISWLNAGLLFQPYEKVRSRPEFRGVTNLHVYTETWRLCGLRLDQPPPPGTYIGTIYEKYVRSNLSQAKESIA